MPHNTDRVITVGVPTVLEVPGPTAPWKVVFEDDAETGYFYAVDSSKPDETAVLDALGIYNVKQVVDRSRPVTLALRWNTDGSKAGLFIEGQPHAVFDFASHRSYAKSGFPSSSRWSQAGHGWDDRAAEGLINH